jgi:hypothetical protein
VAMRTVRTAANNGAGRSGSGRGLARPNPNMSDGPDWQHRGRRNAHLTPVGALLVWRKVAWPLCHPLPSGLGGLTPPVASLLLGPVARDEVGQPYPLLVRKRRVLREGIADAEFKARHGQFAAGVEQVRVIGWTGSGE